MCCVFVTDVQIMYVNNLVCQAPTDTILHDIICYYNRSNTVQLLCFSSFLKTVNVSTLAYGLHAKSSLSYMYDTINFVFFFLLSTRSV